MSKKSSVVQLNNTFIKDENQRRRFEEEENRKRHHFIGYVMLIVMLLFILPTYNLVGSYVKLQERKKEALELQSEYDKLSQDTQAKQQLAEQLKNDDFVSKYARAKYYYSREGEIIYPTPDLLPK